VGKSTGKKVLVAYAELALSIFKPFAATACGIMRKGEEEIPAEITARINLYGHWPG
jgi:hypothetical protein